MTKKQARTFSLKFFRVIWEPQFQATKPELAPKVNRQVSPAVERNRVKRIIREFFRKHVEFFQPGRWVFIAKSAVTRASNREVFADLERILASIQKKSFM